MVQETVLDIIDVPSQEWLNSHTEWYEDAVKEKKLRFQSNLITGIIGVLTMVFIIAMFATYGGY